MDSNFISIFQIVSNALFYVSNKLKSLGTYPEYP